MATTIAEDWSGYAENTQLGNIAGWTVSGFGTNVQALQVNASSQVKNTSSGSGCLAYFDTGSPSHYAKVQMVAPSYPGASYFGPAVRCIGYQDFIGARVRTSDVQIFERTGSNTFNVLAKTVPVSFVSPDELNVIVDGNDLRIEINDVPINLIVNLIEVASLDITGIHSGNNVGLFASGAASNPVFGNLEIGTLSSDTITIDAHPDRTSFPVFGSSIDHVISGSYAIETVSPIQYRVETFVGDVTVVDWTELVSSPSGGTYSAQVQMTRGVYYRILTRFRDNPEIITSTSRIGFGIGIIFNGQSNVQNLFTIGADSAPDDNTAIVTFDGPSWSGATGINWTLPVGQAVIEALNLISAANNCVVACYSSAVGSSTIASHMVGGSNYDNDVAALVAFGGKANGFYWGLGETDAANGNQATHQADLGTIYTETLSRTGQTADTLPMFVVQLGRNEGQTGRDAGWQGVREAQTLYVESNANAYISHQTMDLPMVDSLHRNDLGSMQECLRFSDTFNSVYTGSGNTGLGPVPTSASVNGADVEITHNLNGSTSITLPANAQDGYEVSEDDFASLLTISSISTAANIITLTTSASISGEVKIRSQQGQDPDETKMPTGNLLYSGQAVMVAPIVSELQSVTVSSILNLTATGLPDGSYSAQFWNDDVDPMTRLKVEDVTFTSGQAQTSISLDVGANIYTRIDTPTPLITGTTCKGTTE